MLKKLLACLLSAAMLVAAAFPVAAEIELPPIIIAKKETPNLSLSLESEVTEAGGTVTVSVEIKKASVISVLGCIAFEKTDLLCTSVGTPALKTTGGASVSATATSTVTEANTSGTVAFAFVNTAERTYAAGTVLTATFTVKPNASTPVFLTLYESSDGTDAFSSAEKTEAQTVMLTVSLRPLGYQNLAESAAAVVSSGTASAINDRKNTYAQITGSSGSVVSAGLYWNKPVTLDRLVLFWRDSTYAPPITSAEYAVRVSTDTTNGTDGTWKQISFSRSRRGPSSYLSVIGACLADTEGDTEAERCLMDTVTFDAIAVKGIRVEAKLSSQLSKLQLFEMEAYSETALEGEGLLGDVDKNGAVEADDLTRLARHVGGIETITDAQSLTNADVTKNKSVDADDLTRLARHVGGIELL